MSRLFQGQEEAITWITSINEFFQVATRAQNVSPPRRLNAPLQLDQKNDIETVPNDVVAVVEMLVEKVSETT